jgi:hypothetical protein
MQSTAFWSIVIVKHRRSPRSFGLTPKTLVAGFAAGNSLGSILGSGLVGVYHGKIRTALSQNGIQTRRRVHNAADRNRSGGYE